MHHILLTLGPYHWAGRELGPFNLYAYGFMLALAFACTIPLLARSVGSILAPRIGLSSAEGFNGTLDLFSFAIPASLVGGRLFYVLENHGEFKGQWLNAFKIWEGGLVFYGGLLGAVLAAYVFVRKNRWPWALFLDLAAPYIFLGHAFGRAGCYLQGCCAGVVDSTHGVIFPGLGDGLPHLPTQLWELYGDLVLFGCLLLVQRRLLSRPGAGMALYAVTYGLLRFVLEFWRRDGSAHYLGFFLSPSQAMSALMALAGLVYLVWIFAGRKPVAGNGN